MANTQPIFSSAPEFQSGGMLTTAATSDYSGTNISNTILFTADATNGGWIERIRFKAAGTNTASVARIYINNGLSRLAASIAAVSGTPTGTPSTSGGTLQTGTYFAKIVALDQFGAQTAASTETASVSVASGSTGSIVWNWTAVTGASSYKIYVGPVTGGQLTYFTATTNTYTQTTPIGTRDSLNGSILNNFFYGEIALPATTAIATTSTIDLDYPMGFAIPAGYRVVVGIATTVAAGWYVTIIGGKY